MKDILYTRVSSDEQISNYSLGTQLEACRLYSQSRGAQVVLELSEDYTGTVPIEKRPEGKRAFEMLKTGEADALIAYRFDRIARPPEEGDEWDIPPLIRGLAKIGKEIHTVNRGKIGTSFADLLLAMLDAKVAGDERRQLIERTTRGRRAKAKAGRVVGTGPRLFGYEFHDDAYFVHEPEARLVRRIFELYTIPQSDGKRLGTWGVAWEMERQTGQRWPIVKITRILHHPAYRGQWHYADAVVTIPPIIDDATWNEAQRILKANLMNSPRNTQRVYLLRGLIYCGCGCRSKYMCKALQRRAGEQLYYVPYYQGHQRVVHCTGHAIPAAKADAEAWAYVRECFHSDTFDAILARVAASERDKDSHTKGRLQEIMDELRELDSEAERLAGDVSTGIVGKKIAARIERVNARHEELEVERQMLEVQPDSAASRVPRLIELREGFAYDIEIASDSRRRQIVEAIHLRVTLKKKRGLITSDFGLEHSFVY